ncbi:MAG: D-tyrosyl-tRNA(Tyr) deacylase [Eubacterium sp.]|nr:D-tyrosyl-tRNA(Tyr) deacylase [Eubacterium sp.]MCR4845180.1 D-tyrosyl-tRNA(Tyr) deacylase [Eubacterium sp.]
MKFLIQRVTEASVSVDGKTVGEIGKGFFVLIGVNDTDTEEIADKMIKKLLGLRIFADENGKTNLSLSDAGGSLLLVSQFTLYADCKKGNRPSFIKAGSPEHAEGLYDYIVKKCYLWAEENKSDMKIATGIFGADMCCRLTNDGPFTVDLDSEEL